MKQSEKLDLILRELYKYRFDGRYYNIGGLLIDLNIDFEEYTELRMLCKRLEDDGLIKTMWVKAGANACLTSYGIEYCEETSYSYRTQSQNVNIHYDINQVDQKIKEILKAIEKEKSLNEEEKNEMIDNLDEIITILKADKRPKVSYKTLLENSASIAGISSLVVELGKLIFKL